MRRNDRSVLMPRGAMGETLDPASLPNIFAQAAANMMNQGAQGPGAVLTQVTDTVKEAMEAEYKKGLIAGLGIGLGASALAFGAYLLLRRPAA